MNEMGEISKFNAIGNRESDYATRSLSRPLSGYLAGKERGGNAVIGLEVEWADRFGVKHAIACNSATSGLMAAAFAVGLQRSDQFFCSPMTMSATAAAPMFTNATPRFIDVADDDFGMAPPTSHMLAGMTDAIIVTNLFGHPARLKQWREIANIYGIPMIEDNSQSPFATENGRYAGTVGDIGVFSLNVHKHLQCGEGGMVVTDDGSLAHRIRAFINHGECSDLAQIGLNLRMTEVSAAIALAQFARADEIIKGRVDQAQAIIQEIGMIPGLRPPVVREGCTHVYYVIPFLVEKNRAEFCAALTEAGVPVVEGYQKPLYRLPAFSKYKRLCPVAEGLEANRLFYIENCAWSFTDEQIRLIGKAFHKAAEVLL